MHTHTLAFIYIYIYIFTHTHIYLCIYMYVMFVCFQVEALQQIFREIDRENDNEVNFEVAT